MRRSFRCVMTIGGLDGAASGFSTRLDTLSARQPDTANSARRGRCRMSHGAGLWGALGLAC